MYKWEIVRRIVAGGFVPVIRADSADRALRLIEAVTAGGAVTVEVTMTVPGALDVLKGASESGCLAGAGTVLDAETARLCLLAGAQYLVTPGFFPEVIQVGHRYQKPVLVGAQTVTEVTRALEAGADLIKLFPGAHLGPGFLKALRGPLPQAPCIPTGGVNLDTIADWIQAGAVAVGAGSELARPAESGDYAGVTELTRQFAAAVVAARREILS